MKYVLLLGFIIAPFWISAEETYTYTYPDVRDDFCGVEINYQYCKCAFHGDMCSAIGYEKSSARSYVMGEFKRWVGDQIEAMARNCRNAGNQWNSSSRTCVVQENDTEKEQSLEEKYGLPDMVGVPAPTLTGNFGKITEVKGEVLLYQRSFNRWVLARSGMPIYYGDFVFTREGNTSVIHFAEEGEHVLSLSPESIFEADIAPPEQPREGSLYLGILKGGAAHVYNVAREAMDDKPEVPTWYRQISSPNVAVGVRGTEFILTYDESTDTSSVHLLEGLVDIFPINATSSVSIVPGEEAVVSGFFVATTSLNGWSQVANRYSLSGEHIVITEDMLDRSNVPLMPIDTEAKNEPTREELIGDLSELDTQFEGGGSFLWIIIVLVIFGGGLGYYRLKIQK